MVVRTYFNLGCMHKVAEPNFPLIPVVISETLLAPPLAPWDLPLSPLPEFEVELMSPELPLVETQPQLLISIIELSSTATPRIVAASPPYPEYHPGVTSTYEKDPSEELSFVASCTPQEAESNRRACHIEVLSRHPRIIRTPFVHRGQGGARGRRCSG